MNRSAKKLIKILLENGFEFKRSKGSHQVYYHPGKNKTVIVPLHGKKDIPKGTFYSILKEAGIDKTSL